MKTTKTFALLLALVVGNSFTFGGNKDKLINCNVAAKTVQVGKNKVVTCQRSLLKDTIDMPLSELIANFQIVKLDDSDKALVNQNATIISDNYILVRGSDNNPYKLFDKKGKFITNVGAVGQGPGEYKLVYDQQIDEKNKRIYLLPWSAKNILVYDLTGKFLNPVPLCEAVPKGIFRVNPNDNTITVAKVPFEGSKYIVWQQTMSGKLLKSVAPGKLSVVLDFSNELLSNKSITPFDFSILGMGEKPDSLYHYDTAGNALIPCFTIDFGSQKLPIHTYLELPKYYQAYFAEPIQVSATSTSVTNQRFAFIDKKTLKGAFYRLKNDFLGGLPLTRPGFVDGYWIQNIDPGNLADDLESILKTNKNMSKEMRDKVTKLKKSITDNDNNYVLYGKLKP